MYNQKSFRPPVQAGDEINLRIEAVGEKGDGMGKYNGFVLFVPGTKEGESCRVRVTKVFKKVGFAEKVGQAKAAPKASQRTPRRAPAELPPLEPDPEDSEDFGDDVEEKEPNPEMPTLDEEES